MKDESRIILNALLTYGSRGSALVVGLFMVPYLLGYLGEERYGTIGIANSLLGLLLLVEMGLQPAASRQFTRFLASGETLRANQLASTAMAIYAGLGLLALAMTVASADRFLGWMQFSSALAAETWSVLVVVAGSLVAALLRAPYEAALASQLRYDVTQYCEAGGVVFRAVFVVVSFWLLEPSLLLWALGALVWSGIALAIHAWQAYRHCPTLQLEPGLITRRGARDLAGLGSLAGVMRLSHWLSEFSGPLVISAFLGPAAVAYYAPAIALGMALNPLSRAFLQQLTPVVTRAWTDGDSALIARVLIRSTRYSLLVGGAAAALLASLSSALIPVWLGPGFAITAWVAVARAGQSFLQAGAGGSFAVFMGMGRLGVPTAINSTVAVSGVALGAYLVGWTELGVLGPAIAMFAAQALRSVGWFAFITRLAGVPRGSYLREALAGPLLAIGVLVAVSLGVQWLLDAPPLLELLAASGTALAAYAACAWRIGLIAEDRTKALAYARLGLAAARSVLARRRAVAND